VQISLGSYFASLSPRGSVSFERAIVTIAERWGFAAALPLALFLPPALRADGDLPALLVGFPSLAAGRFAAAPVSALDLVAFSQALDKVVARARRVSLEQSCNRTREQPRAHGPRRRGRKRGAWRVSGQWAAAVLTGAAQHALLRPHSIFDALLPTRMLRGLGDDTCSTGAKTCTRLQTSSSSSSNSSTSSSTSSSRSSLLAATNNGAGVCHGHGSRHPLP
jgi:hypothetical protein